MSGIPEMEDKSVAIEMTVFPGNRGTVKLVSATEIFPDQTLLDKTLVVLQ